MFVKVFIFMILTMTVCQAGTIGRAATQEQLDTLCVPIRLRIDGDVHWFHYKTIAWMNHNGVCTLHGKNLSRRTIWQKDEVLNFEEAEAKWKRLKELKP